VKTVKVKQTHSLVDWTSANWFTLTHCIIIWRRCQTS